MKSLYSAAAILALAAVPAFAQTPAPAAPSRPNALVEFPAKSSAKLTVTTPAWTDGGDIPFENTQYRSNTFPGLDLTDILYHRHRETIASPPPDPEVVGQG